MNLSKWIVALFLPVSVIFPVFSAEYAFRCDLFSHQYAVPLLPRNEGNDLKLSHPAWAPGKQAYLSGEFALKDGGWRQVDFAFSVEQDTPVTVKLLAGNAVKAEDRLWVAVSEVKVNGQYPFSPDFSRVNQATGFPQGFYASAKAKPVLIRSEEAPKVAVKVNHDNPLCFGLSLKADVLYRVSLLVRRAPEADGTLVP